MSVSEYAVLSSAVYSAPDRQAALDMITTSSKGKFNGADYSVLEGDADYMVFRRRSDGHVVVACRGTRDTTDVIPDVFIAMGLLRFHPRSKKILAVVDRYKYLGVDVSVTGHSLGGKLAALIGATEGVLAVTFNQGASPMDSNPAVVTMQEKLFGYNYNNVVHVTTAIDGVSTTEAIAHTNRTIIVTPPSYINPLTNHGLAAFLDMSDEDATRADGAIDQEDTRIRKEQRETPLVDDVSRQLSNVRTYVGNALNMYRTHRDLFQKVLGEESLEEMDRLMVAGDMQAEERMKQMLRIAFDDAADGDANSIFGDEITDAQLDEMLTEEAGRVDRENARSEGMGGDEFDADLDEIGEGGGGDAGDEFDADLDAVERVDEGGNVGIDEFLDDIERGGAGGADGSAGRGILSEEEFIEDLGKGLSGASTAAARLNIFERNIKNIEGLPVELRAELLGKVAELRASQTVVRTLENAGLPGMARAVAGISTKLGAKWTILMAKNVSFFRGAYVLNVGKVVTKIGKVMDAVMIITQAAFLASEIYDLVTIKNEMEKILDTEKLPEFKFLRFKLKSALVRMQKLLDYGTEKASLHGVELAVGIFLTCFPGLQGFAVAWWSGVAAGSIAEIGADAYVSNKFQSEFVARWYGVPPDFNYHVLLRDSDAMKADETGDVHEYLQWVASGLQLGSFNLPAYAYPILEGHALEMIRRVDEIVKDPNVENGIADNRYERLVQLQSEVPIQLWVNGIQQLWYYGVIQKPDISTIDAVIVLGARGFTPETMKQYQDLQRFRESQRLKLLRHSTHEEHFLSSGNKPQGDSETDEEYEGRLIAWIDRQVLEQSERMRARVSDRAPIAAGSGLIDIPGAGDSNGDGQVCAWQPRKKPKTLVVQ